MWILSIVSAWGCGETSAEVIRARAAFDDAEVEEAHSIVKDALSDLGCQASIVNLSTLLELYRVDGLIALSRMDNQGAVYATIRAVTADPTSPPTAEYGPELAALHASWVSRLASSKALLTVSGGGVVYVDGRPIQQGDTLSVLQGEHLIQIDSGTKVSSLVVDVGGNQPILTGLLAPTSAPDVVEVIPSPSEPRPEERPPEKKENAWKRRPNTPLLIIGGVLAVAGGATLGYAVYRDEVEFQTKQFDSVEALNNEVSAIRALYGVGYGTLGVGAVVMGIGAIGNPVGVQVNGRF